MTFCFCSACSIVTLHKYLHAWLFVNLARFSTSLSLKLYVEVTDQIVEYFTTNALITHTQYTHNYNIIYAATQVGILLYGHSVLKLSAHMFMCKVYVSILLFTQNIYSYFQTETVVYLLSSYWHVYTLLATVSWQHYCYNIWGSYMLLSEGLRLATLLQLQIVWYSTSTHGYNMHCRRGKLLWIPIGR